MEKTHIIEKSFTHSNKQCVVIFTNMGHRCGYVAVEKDSPLNNIDYNDLYSKHNIDIYVHGGITFFGKLNPDISKEPLFWFGFDCAHLYDGKDFEAIKKYFGQKEFDQAKKYDFYSTYQPKSLQYCINECKHLAEQLTKSEKEIKKGAD